MAISKFYLKRTTTTVSGTLPGTAATVSATTPSTFGASGQLSYTMNATISTSNATNDTATVGATAPIAARSALISRWYSDPIAAQTISSQTITVQAAIAVGTSGLDSNFTFSWSLAVWRPSTGTLVGRVWDLVTNSAEPTATNTATLVTVSTGGTSTPVTAQNGDILVLEAWRYPLAPDVTNNRSNLVYFDGTTEGSASNNAAYLEFTNAVAMNIRANATDAVTASDTVTFSTSGNVGTRKFYLHTATSTVPGTFPASNATVSATTPTVITTTALNDSMDSRIGTAQASVVHATGGNTNTQSGLIARFISQRLAAQTISSQTITLSIAANQSNNDSNFYVTWSLAVWRPSTGTLVGRIWDLVSNTAEVTTSQAVYSLGTGGTSTSVTAAAGDVLILEVWRRPFAQGSSNPRNNTIFFDGTTEGSASSTAAFLEFANSVQFDNQQRPISDTVTVTDAVSVPITRGISDSVTVTDAADWTRGRTLYLTPATTGVASGDRVADTASVSATTPSKITTGTLNRALVTNRSNTQSSALHSTLAQTAEQSGLIARWYSEPLSAQTISAQTFKLRIGAVGQSGSNFSVACSIAVWRPSTQSVVARLHDLDTSTAVTATIVPVLFNVVGEIVSATVQAGDVLVLEAWRAPATQTSATSLNNYVYFGANYDAPTFYSSYLAFSEVPLFDQSRGIADTLAVTDTLSTQPGRNITDTATISDAAAANTAADRAVTDTITVTEDIDAVGPSGNVSHEAELTESITVTDAITTAVTLTVTIADTLTVTDAFASPGSVTRTITDAVSLTDTAAGISAASRAAADTATASDDVTGALAASRDAADAVTGTDTLTSPGALTRTATDTIAAADVADAVAAPARGVTDTVAASDTIGGPLATDRSISITLTVSDTLTGPGASTRSIADTITLADTSTAALVLSRPVTDAVTVTDALASPGASVRGITDTLATSDAAEASSGQSRAVADTVALTEAVTLVVAIGVLSTITVTDAVTGIVSSARATAATVTVGDAAEATAGATRAADTSVTVTEATAGAVALVRIGSDGVTITDVAGGVRALTGGAADTAGLTDAVAARVAAARPVSDGAGLADLSARALTQARSALDALTAADAVTSEVIIQTPPPTQAVGGAGMRVSGLPGVSSVVGGAGTSAAPGDSGTVYASGGPDRVEAL